MKYTYKTKGVCSRQIDLEIENDVIVGAKFIGGCSGNTQGVAALVIGMTAEEVRQWIIDHADELPYPARLERDVSWIHMDTRCNSYEKVELFG